MEDYEKLGMKCGLEIHQQLDTHKLFCNCQSELRNEEPEFEIKRKLHAIAGETGDVDVAVKFEAGKDREFTYQGYSQNTCLVELDESPPEMINLESLKITLQVALLLNCEVFPATQIMRKTVIDGSNTSGFQRTVLIARNGFVETAYGRVGIDTVALEEDAARIIKQGDDKITYRLDRLGIPLIEIATAPDIKNPEQVKEVALHIGDILRACKVKRGIGTIRQDINISIKGHPRIEIKGFQEPKMMVVIAEKEIERQIKNIKEKNLIKEVRKANPDGTTSFLRPMPGAARMYPETDLPLLNISRDLINGIKANLPKLRSDIKEELKGHGLNDEMINLIVSENKLDELKELIQINSDSSLIAKMLVLWPKEISIKEKISLDEINKKLTLDVLEIILQAINNKKIQKYDVQAVLLDIVKGKSVNEAIKLEKQSNEDLEKEIIKIIKEKPGLNINAYMGLIMARFKGKVSGKEVIEMLNKYVKS
ncbi:Glu-tRNA(Gln) amidotransferase subunit GatE [Candidatus Pacearchaeota archaeon]|nr:Glu-tRNA(Gln) amidotransferase subunit GatE [Candidatus Pacearchaeota archaeon]